MEIEYFKNNFIPVLLGSSKKATLYAKYFFQLHRITSHLFNETISVYEKLCPYLKTHRVSNIVLATALLDYAHQFSTADRLLYLIPCTNQARKFIDEHPDLESYYIIHKKDRSFG